MKKYKKDLEKETDRLKYVSAVVEGELNMHQEDVDLEHDMENMGLRRIETTPGRGKTFDYLLSMQMRSMTTKKMDEIRKEIKEIKAQVVYYKTHTAVELWRSDLVRFRKAYAKFLTTRTEETVDDFTKGKKGKKGVTTKK